MVKYVIFLNLKVKIWNAKNLVSHVHFWHPKKPNLASTAAENLATLLGWANSIRLKLSRDYVEGSKMTQEI